MTHSELCPTALGADFLSVVVGCCYLSDHIHPAVIHTLIHAAANVYTAPF